MSSAVMPTSSEISVLFRYPSRSSFRKILRRPLRRFLCEAAGHVLPGKSVACLITDDSELRALNRRFLHKDHATDVLSFPASIETGNGELGEVAISLDRAAAQAAGFGHSVEEELCILMLHGLLHLAGMDHEIDHGQMARAEARWRKRLKLPPGLMERAKA
jgi:probable rRNA maturation factor